MEFFPFSLQVLPLGTGRPISTQGALKIFYLYLPVILRTLHFECISFWFYLLFFTIVKHICLRYIPSKEGNCCWSGLSLKRTLNRRMPLLLYPLDSFNNRYCRYRMWTLHQHVIIVFVRSRNLLSIQKPFNRVILL